MYIDIQKTHTHTYTLSHAHTCTHICTHAHKHAHAHSQKERARGECICMYKHILMDMYSYMFIHVADHVHCAVNACASEDMSSCHCTRKQDRGDTHTETSRSPRGRAHGRLGRCHGVRCAASCSSHKLSRSNLLFWRQKAFLARF